MVNNLIFFRTLCRLCAAVFILLCFFPLATLAFHQSSPQQAEEAVAIPTEPNTKTQPEASYLDSDPNPSIQGNLPVYDTISLSERRKLGLPTALPATELYYGEKTVYLTFDDGPDPDNTPVILKVLREQGVKATFFVVGSEVEKYPDLLKQVYQEGHAIGNHTYSHVYRDIYKSVGTYSAELNRTDETIKKAIGVRPRITRAPGGSAGSFTREYWDTLKTLGYIEVGWNVSSGDASRAKATQLVANIESQVTKNKFLWSHVIVLMHDGRGHAETAKALPEIIKIFKDRGFEFRVVNLETPPAW
jgi:peptidoglycan/xylan/chitin deacetylase (PgdA/CDA1 family)